MRDVLHALGAAALTVDELAAPLPSPGGEGRRRGERARGGGAGTPRGRRTLSPDPGLTDAAGLIVGAQRVAPAARRSTAPWLREGQEGVRRGVESLGRLRGCPVTAPRERRQRTAADDRRRRGAGRPDGMRRGVPARARGPRRQRGDAPLVRLGPAAASRVAGRARPARSPTSSGARCAPSRPSSDGAGTRRPPWRASSRRCAASRASSRSPACSPPTRRAACPGPAGAAVCRASSASREVDALVAATEGTEPLALRDRADPRAALRLRPAQPGTGGACASATCRPRRRSSSCTARAARCASCRMGDEAAAALRRYLERGRGALERPAGDAATMEPRREAPPAALAERPRAC